MTFNQAQIYRQAYQAIACRPTIWTAHVLGRKKDLDTISKFPHTLFFPNFILAHKLQIFLFRPSDRLIRWS